MANRKAHLSRPKRQAAAPSEPDSHPRSQAKRAAILDTAIRHFSKRGYREALVEDMAKELKIAKGSIFQHFKTKEGLFLAAYKRAIQAIPTWLDAPSEWKQKGFFGVVRYWLERPVNLSAEDWIRFQVVLMGTYGTDLSMKKEITRFLDSQDPYETEAFVRWGIQRGEVRDDVDPKLIVSMLNWMMEQYEDGLLAERLTPGIFHRTQRGGRSQRRIEQELELLRSALVKV